MSNIVKISIPLEKVVVFAEKAVREYNKQAKTSKCIEKTFRRCGQHIWDEDLSAFQEHLGGLKKDSTVCTARSSATQKWRTSVFLKIFRSTLYVL